MFFFRGFDFSAALFPTPIFAWLVLFWVTINRCTFLLCFGLPCSSTLTTCSRSPSRCSLSWWNILNRDQRVSVIFRDVLVVWWCLTAFAVHDSVLIGGLWVVAAVFPDECSVEFAFLSLTENRSMLPDVLLYPRIFRLHGFLVTGL